MDNLDTNQALAEFQEERSAEERIEQARMQRMLDECGTEYAKMKKNIRSWGFWLVGIGIVSMVLSFLLDPSWGLMLMVVGLSSFYFCESSMFVVYGSILAWAAVSNLMAGTLWAVFAVFQAILAFKVFRQYGKWRKVEKTYRYHHKMGRVNTPPTPERAARIFPWLSAILSIASLATLLGVVGGMAVSPVVEEDLAVMTGLDWAAIFAVNLGVLGLALGIASLLSRYKQKPSSVAGVVIGGLVLVFTIGAMVAAV
ncbi:MAG: hypothetical protein PVJ42_00315 [bacterium]|jgi:hypothetical protein